MGILVMELDLTEDQAILFPERGFGQNILTFRVYTSSSPHIDNKKKTF